MIDPATNAVLFSDASTFTGSINALTGTQSPCAPVFIKKIQGYGCPPPIGGDHHGQD